MSIQVLNHPDAGVDAKAAVGQSITDTSGQVRDRRLTREDVPNEWHHPVFEADDFIIEGPASVEIVDRSGQQIQMEAVREALDRFMLSEREPGIISDKHDDVPVGVPLWDWTTDDGQRYETVVEGDRFQLVSNLGNETTMSKLARLRCLNGDYGGYSITVYSNEEVAKPDGTCVTTNCDLHAVTIGHEDLVMNPAADFDVVDFKHGGILEASIRRRLRRRDSMTGRVEQKLRDSSSSSSQGDDSLAASLLDRLRD
ncbi:hypothetical protein C440_05647 [Haloferax mucosum ATCC BAA-1512]|uniref:Uncharacterized protein n=1 Tax=Haloferax mucosum ATCC BAA-1512 TaxID=662479 RepID=M0IKT4_9EURY|nr:hypothetical protein [Haloferax mucosum]ELZ96049.1 hypothetical protein C440_05647 [Haloferax mucosum ATCC BAA-1512]